MITEQVTEFGELLRRYRVAAGLSQEALAARAGLSARGISDLERGLRHAPQRQTLQLLAEALGLSAEQRATLEAVVVRRRGPAGAVRDAGEMPDNGTRRLPTGTVTFLFTDVEGSTRLWERQPEAMRRALMEHDTIVEAQVAQHGGVVIRPRGEGDSRFVVFARATSAVAAAASIQQALHAVSWPTGEPLRVRMALHTGEADLRQGDYYGREVNRCARLRAIGHGGQTLLTQATYDLIRFALPEGVDLRDLGEYRLVDLAIPERVFQIVIPHLPSAFPPLRAPEHRRHNLPAQATSFVGREQEIAPVRPGRARRAWRSRLPPRRCWTFRTECSSCRWRESATRTWWPRRSAKR
jgi:class 3 adenylate cyclase